jgi:RNA polymerase sigma-70 factor (ECF subfamily)
VAEPTDEELVGLTRAGDGSAYSTLVARYQGHVYGLAYSLAGNWADAQDIAQETFIRAYVNLAQLRDPARFAPWLRRVTFGVAMNWLKAFRPGFFQQIQGQVDLDGLEVPDFAPGPPEVVERRELADAVRRAIDSLPSKYRVPLTMFHLNGLSYRKVAQFLDIPLGTAQSLIHRARKKLKTILGAYYSEDVAPMVQEVFNEHKLPAEFSREVWNLEYDVRGFSDLLSMRACLTQAGVEVNWDDLLGYSGDAFGCDGMSYFSLRGHDVLTEAARSYGFEGRWRFGPHEAHGDLRASLAKKQPCITAGFDGRCLWWVVVLGERADQNQFLIAGAGEAPQWISTPTRDDTGPNWVGQCPWAEGALAEPDGAPENWQPCPRLLLGNRGEPLPPAVRFRNALQLALTTHRREGFAYHWGGEERETEAVGRGYLKQWPGLMREWSELRGWSETGEQEPLDVCDPDPRRAIPTRTSLPSLMA